MKNKIDILIAGNYCHDTLVRESHNDISMNETILDRLGGSAAYISKALSAAQTTTPIHFKIISKVGNDFKYHHENGLYPAIISQTHLTAHFYDHMTVTSSTSTLKTMCEAISAQDILNNNSKAKIGIIGGVALEILPETIQAMRNQVDFLICDIQSLIRKVKSNGEIFLTPLAETEFMPELLKIDLLKMNITESKNVILSQLPKTCQWVITRGDDGTLFFDGANEFRIDAIKIKEIDSTGAGDSFIAGTAIGIIQGMPLLDAIKLGNRYGAFAVQSLGIPDFSKFS